MTLSLTTQEMEGVRLIDMAGRLTVIDKSFSETMQEFLKNGERHFVLRMSQLHSIDMDGLGQLITLYNLVRRAGGSLSFFAPNTRVRTLLRITKLDTVFYIIGDELPNPLRLCTRYDADRSKHLTEVGYEQADRRSGHAHSGGSSCRSESR